MTTIKDYIGKYYQTVLQYMEGVDKRALEDSIDAVIKYARFIDHDKSELIDFHDNRKVFGEESYKYDVFDKAHEALCLEKWDISSIGSGIICGYVANAMAHTDNLVNRQFGIPGFLSLLNTSEKTKREQYERALYEIYWGDDEEKAFKDASGSNCFGGKYALLAFLFFIKDRDRFLPTSPETFDSIFESIGLPFRMSKRCSWANYCKFIAIISCVQEYLTKSGVCSHEVSLLDAHSAVWVMNYSEFKAWQITTKDINTPMKPKEIVNNPDGSINYICPRCDYSLKQNERCPSCGQRIEK